MSPDEFDDMYEMELKRLRKTLPDPNTYPYDRYRLAVVFQPTLIDMIPKEIYLKDPNKRPVFHELFFEKFPDLQTGGMKWLRIIYHDNP
jgi:hypothetical protein